MANTRAPEARSSDAHAEAFCASGSSPTPPTSLPPGAVGRLPAAPGEDRLPSIDYELVGSPEGRPLVVLGGISADRHVTASRVDPSPGWWEEIVGDGRAIDTRSFRVLSFNFLAGPDSVSTADQARVLAALLDQLGVECVDRIVGASYGGMVGLAFAAAFPERVESLLLIGAAHRPHPMATAWRALQRRIVDLGARSDRPQRGLELARGLAMTTYRSAREFDRRFGAPATDGASESPGAESPGGSVESYLEARGRAFADTFLSDAFVRLSESIDLHRVEPAGIRVPADLVAIESDALAPPWLMEELAAGLSAPVRLRRIDSDLGHDAFLADAAAIGPVLTELLEAAEPTSEPASRVTRAVRAGVGADREHGAVMPPLHLSANFTFERLGRKREHDYTRTSNPTRDHLAVAIAELEDASGAVITSSGMSAVALVFQLLRPDDLLVVTHDCYGGTHRLATRLGERGAFRVEFADLTTAEGISACADRRPRMIWIETPSNPLLRITDLTAVADAARECGALVAADNTLLSPALQRPIEHGVDLVVHSTTKFINGHSDVVGGAVAAAEPAMLEEIGWWANCLGLGGSPFDSYLTLRGLRTLDARVRVHQQNAMAVAETLEAHPAVSRVHYPGLPGHEGHELAARQQSGWGSLVSFELHAGEPAVAAFAEGLEHFALAESLGGVESLVAHPSSMTHAAMEPRARAAAGIGDALLRLSVGIEGQRDLLADLRRGLERASRVR